MSIVVHAQIKTEERIQQLFQAQREMAEAHHEMVEVQREMAEAQRHTDERLSALIDIVIQQRNDKS